MSKLKDRQLSEDEVNRFTVRFDFARKFAENAHITRTIGKRTNDVQLANIHEFSKDLLTATDTVDLGAPETLAPVKVIYRWETGDTAQEFKVFLKRSWIISGPIDLRNSNLIATKSPNVELNLEYVILQSNAKIIIGPKTLNVRARFIGSEPGSSIVSFTDESPRANDEPASSGSVVLQAKDLSGQLSADLHGANGKPGAPGADRSPSERGADGVAGFGSESPCRIFRQSTPGEQGPAGHPGQPGENGGDGGSLTIRTQGPASNLSISFSSVGGKGGAGGPGGRGGPGGKGADRILISVLPFCVIPNSNGGPDGTIGPTGSAGKDGKSNSSLQKLPPLPEETDPN